MQADAGAASAAEATVAPAVAPITIGRPISAHRCHVDRYPDDITVDIDTRIMQYDQEQGFIHCNDPSQVEVTVTLGGRLVDLLCFILCVAVHVECYGPDDPPRLPTQRAEVVPCEDHKYTLTWDIPADYFCAPDGYECGLVCCFAFTVTSLTKCGGPGPMGCMFRGPCVMIHEGP
jgi:hypothetical protein